MNLSMEQKSVYTGAMHVGAELRESMPCSISIVTAQLASRVALFKYFIDVFRGCQICKRKKIYCSTNSKGKIGAIEACSRYKTMHM